MRSVILKALALFIMVHTSSISFAASTVREIHLLIQTQNIEVAFERLKVLQNDKSKLSAETQMLMGMIYLELEQPAKAKTYFEKITFSTTTMDDIANAGMARAELMLGNLTIARDFAEDAFKANPDRVENKLALAAVLSEQLLFPRSEKMFESAMRASRKSSLAGRLYAQAMLRRNKLNEAEKILKQTLIKQGNDGPTLALYSELEWERNNFKKSMGLRIQAEQSFREAGNLIKAGEMLAWLNIEAVSTLKKIPAPPKKPQPKMREEPQQTSQIPQTQKPEFENQSLAQIKTALKSSPPRKSFNPRVKPESIMIDDSKGVVTGSGVILKNGEWVLTNRHVVEDTEYLIVRNGLGEVRNVKEVFIAENDDLAVIVLETAFPGDYSLSVGDFSAAETGSDVFVMGYPMSSIFGTFHPTITTGIVSNPLGFGGAEGQFQMTAKINPGNSGGPIFNRFGQIVGVATGNVDKALILEEDGFIPEDISFGVTSRRAYDFLNRPTSSSPSHFFEYNTVDLYKYMRSAVVFIVGQ